MRIIYLLIFAILALLVGVPNLEAEELGSNLSLVGSYDTNGGWANGVTISGNYAYVASGGNGLIGYYGLIILNIEDPANPTWVGSYGTGNAQNVAISGNYAYVADGWNGLVILNIEDPANPTWVGIYDGLGNARSINISGNYAYVADGSYGFAIINIED